MRTTPDSVLLDVRTKEELSDVIDHLAVHIDYLSPDLADHIEVLDPNKSYFVYCRTGRRSIRVCTLMRNAGFQKVYNLSGGLISKQDANSTD